MKHLRKFNESERESLDIEYIKHCFIDILENEDYDCEIDEEGFSDDNSVLCIFLYEPQINLELQSLDEYLNNIDQLSKLSKELKSSTMKLKDEYPNYKVNINIDDAELLNNKFPGDGRKFYRILKLVILLH